MEVLREIECRDIRFKVIFWDEEENIHQEWAGALAFVDNLCLIFSNKKKQIVTENRHIFEIKFEYA